MSVNMSSIVARFIDWEYEDFSELSAWIDTCEERLSLSVPVDNPRKERREPVPIKLNRVVTNASNSGFCLTTVCALPDNEHIHVSSDFPVSSTTASVRWAGRLQEDAFVAECNCC